MLSRCPTTRRTAGVPPSANASKNVGRGVPDVAADADPATGYTVRVDGENTVIGGTSAVAPLWAGLVALLEPGPGQAGRLPESDALRLDAPERRLSRHHERKQRHLLGRPRLGRLHRPRRRRRNQAVDRPLFLTLAGTLRVPSAIPMKQPHSVRPVVPGERSAPLRFRLTQSWKLKILFHQRTSHQAIVYRPPLILAAPRRPGSSFRSVLSMGMITS